LVLLKIKFEVEANFHLSPPISAPVHVRQYKVWPNRTILTPPIEWRSIDLDYWNTLYTHINTKHQGVKIGPRQNVRHNKVVIYEGEPPPSAYSRYNTDFGPRGVRLYFGILLI